MCWLLGFRWYHLYYCKRFGVSDSDCDVSEIKEDVVADMCGFGPDSDIGSGDNAGDAFVLASEGCVFVISRWYCLIYCL
jgi:hypothetical protein